MDRLKRGIAFWVQAWQMAKADPDLLKPSLYAAIAGLIVTVVGIVLIVGSVLLLGDRSLGHVVTGFFGVLLVFALLAVGYVFSAMTVYLVYGYLAEGDGRLDQAWAIVRRDWLDILSLAAASALISLLKSAARGRGRDVGRNLLAGVIDTVWTEAAYLVLPVMVIEDLNLKNGMLRVIQIVREHLLLVGLSTVGVRLVNGLIGLVLWIAGAAAGTAAGMGVANAFGAGTRATIAGIAVGVLVASLFILASAIASSYSATAYHTCLYLWARDVERARAEGEAESAAPTPLAVALGRVQGVTAEQAYP